MYPQIFIGLNEICMNGELGSPGAPSGAKKSEPSRLALQAKISK
jgi:hypothetical protein